MGKTKIGIAVLLLTVAGAFLLPRACSSPLPRRNPTGELFPSVAGESLAGEPVQLPGDLAGAPALLLLGYDQDAQFDLDRWLFGLVQSKAAVRVLEVPTVRGWVPRMISDTIDSGMRRGIPEEDWRSVVTVYRDADAVGAFTGTENGLTARVLLLDESGVVTWYHDRGYSAGKLVELLTAIEASAAQPHGG